MPWMSTSTNIELHREREDDPAYTHVKSECCVDLRRRALKRSGIEKNEIGEAEKETALVLNVQKRQISQQEDHPEELDMPLEKRAQFVFVHPYAILLMLLCLR